MLISDTNPINQSVRSMDSESAKRRQRGVCVKEASGAAYPAGRLSVTAPTEGEEKDWVLILMTENGEPPVKDRVYYELEQAEEKKVFEW